MKSYTYPIGGLIVFETGEYSDRNIGQFYVLLKTLDLVAERERFCVLWPTIRQDEWEDEPQAEEFESWLFREGYLLPVPYNLVHLGSYGRLELS